MTHTSLRLALLALVAGVVLVGPGVQAQEAAEGVKFAKPVRLKAGDAFLGEGRLYPSPAIHDANGDGLRDVVIADLRGLVTVAPAVAKEDGLSLGKETSFLDRDGKPIDFDNW